jgi:hypothetical protein
VNWPARERSTAASCHRRRQPGTGRRQPGRPQRRGTALRRGGHGAGRDGHGRRQRRRHHGRREHGAGRGQKAERLTHDVRPTSVRPVARPEPTDTPAHGFGPA